MGYHSMKVTNLQFPYKPYRDLALPSHSPRFLRIPYFVRKMERPTDFQSNLVNEKWGRDSPQDYIKLIVLNISDKKLFIAFAVCHFRQKHTQVHKCERAPMAQ